MERQVFIILHCFTWRQRRTSLRQSTSLRPSFQHRTNFSKTHSCGYKSAFLPVWKAFGENLLLYVLKCFSCDGNLWRWKREWKRPWWTYTNENNSRKRKCSSVKSLFLAGVEYGNWSKSVSLTFFLIWTSFQQNQSTRSCYTFSRFLVGVVVIFFKTTDISKTFQMHLQAPVHSMQGNRCTCKRRGASDKRGEFQANINDLTAIGKLHSMKLWAP